MNRLCLMRVACKSLATDKLWPSDSQANWNLKVCVLWRNEHRRNRRKTLVEGRRTNNKLNAHITPGPGIEPAPVLLQHFFFQYCSVSAAMLREIVRTPIKYCCKDCDVT